MLFFTYLHTSVYVHTHAYTHNPRKDYVKIQNKLEIDLKYLQSTPNINIYALF